MSVKVTAIFDDDADFDDVVLDIVRVCGLLDEDPAKIAAGVLAWVNTENLVGQYPCLLYKAALLVEGRLIGTDWKSIESQAIIDSRGCRDEAT